MCIRDSFLPYLRGERTPHFDPTASGALVGLRIGHGPAEVTRAVLEGVAYALGEGLDLMRGLGLYSQAAHQVQALAEGVGDSLENGPRNFGRPVADPQANQSAARGGVEVRRPLASQVRQEEHPVAAGRNLGRCS